MAIVIEMPKLSDTMTEGKILSWVKSEGDELEPGEVLAEVESDKANMEIEAYDPGFLRKIVVPDGGSCPVGSAIAVITEEADEDIADLLAQMASGGSAAPPASDPAPAPVASPTTNGNAGQLKAQAAPAGAATAVIAPPATPAAPPRMTDGRILASPLALRMASEFGLDLRQIAGSGPDGRIVKRDIEQAKRHGVAAPVAAAPPVSLAGPIADGVAYEDVPVSGMRRTIAQRLTESKVAAPHFYLTVEIDMKRAIAARTEMNELGDTKISYNDLVVKASAVALARNPAMNASWQGESIRFFKSIDIGVAVAIPDGLVTPVLRGCHLKGLSQISNEVRDFAQRAKDKKLSPDEYQGGSFTISNLGMFGVKSFTAIINPPQAAILAVSGIQEVPVVENGQVVPGHRMECTLSSDHRVVDGALAAQFMKDLKAILENPVSLAL